MGRFGFGSKKKHEEPVWLTCSTTPPATPRKNSKQLYSPRTRGTALLTGLYGRHDYVDSPAGQRLYRAPIVGLKKCRLASR